MASQPASLPFFMKKKQQDTDTAASSSSATKACCGGGKAAATAATSASVKGSGAGGASKLIAPTLSATGSSSSSKPAAAAAGGKTKVEHKAVYDLVKKELKNRTEAKLSSGAKVGVNYSDKTNLVSIDAEKGPLRVGYDFQRNDAVLQYTRKSKAGTFKLRQLVPNMHWEVVPSPVVELSTKLMDGSRFKDNLKLVYDFNNRFAYYTETLKFQKKFKVRVAGDSKSSDTALCIGYKPDLRWLKSVKVLQTPATGPLLCYKVKPASGWKVAAEASLRSKTLATSLTYKAQKGETELVLDAAVPLPGNTNSSIKLLQKAGVKMQVLF